MNPWKAAKRDVKRRLVEFAGRHMNLNFRPSPTILSQRIEFLWREGKLTVEADFKTPLYETIGEIVTYDCYQLDKCKLPQTANGVVIDVGGNVGVAAVVLAQNYHGRVISIEPIQANCAAIEKNIALNGFHNIQVMRTALCDKDGELDLWMDPDQSVSAFSRGEGAKEMTGLVRMSVPSISLPTLMAQIGDDHVDLLKMDCEGGEYSVIDQIDESLAKRIPLITMEVHDIDPPVRSIKSLQRKLSGLGYELSYKPELSGRFNLHYLLAVHKTIKTG